MGSNITIDDVAKALGISKTTVSRAISGRGRVSEKTKKRVLEYIKEVDYVPNAMAKGLAQRRNFNICVTLPGDYNAMELSFFHSILVGISDYLADKEYDILIAKVTENDISGLKRIVNNKKVDGVILTRTVIDGEAIKFLKTIDMPYLAIGSCPYDDVVQIDSMNYEGALELTSILLSKNFKKISLVCGNMLHYVTSDRLNGFKDAFKQANMKFDSSLLYTDVVSESGIDKAVEDALRNGTDCIVCMDDYICTRVLRKLKTEKKKVPRDVKVASFYGSPILEFNVPAITCLEYPEDEIGMLAARTMLEMLEGEEDVPLKQRVGYNVVLKESTKIV